MPDSNSLNSNESPNTGSGSPRSGELNDGGFFEEIAFDLEEVVAKRIATEKVKWGEALIGGELKGGKITSVDPISTGINLNYRVRTDLGGDFKLKRVSPGFEETASSYGIQDVLDHEVAAYLVAERIKPGMIPRLETVTLAKEKVLIQEWAPDAKPITDPLNPPEFDGQALTPEGIYRFQVELNDIEAFRRMVGDVDQNPQNNMVKADGRVIYVDPGFAFPEPEYISPIAGMESPLLPEIPERVSPNFAEGLKNFRPAEVRETLIDLVGADRIEGFERRVQELQKELTVGNIVIAEEIPNFQNHTRRLATPDIRDFTWPDSEYRILYAEPETDPVRTDEKVFSTTVPESKDFEAFMVGGASIANPEKTRFLGGHEARARARGDDGIMVGKERVKLFDRKLAIPLGEGFHAQPFETAVAMRERLRAGERIILGLERELLSERLKYFQENAFYIRQDLKPGEKLLSLAEIEADIERRADQRGEETFRKGMEAGRRPSVEKQIAARSRFVEKERRYHQGMFSKIERLNRRDQRDIEVLIGNVDASLLKVKGANTGVVALIPVPRLERLELQAMRIGSSRGLDKIQDLWSLTDGRRSVDQSAVLKGEKILADIGLDRAMRNAFEFKETMHRQSIEVGKQSVGDFLPKVMRSEETGRTDWDLTTVSRLIDEKGRQREKTVRDRGAESVKSGLLWALGKSEGGAGDAVFKAQHILQNPKDFVRGQSIREAMGGHDEYQEARHNDLMELLDHTRKMLEKNPFEERLKEEIRALTDIRGEVSNGIAERSTVLQAQVESAWDYQLSVSKAIEKDSERMVDDLEPVPEPTFTEEQFQAIERELPRADLKTVQSFLDIIADGDFHESVVERAMRTGGRAIEEHAARAAFYSERAEILKPESPSPAPGAQDFPANLRRQYTVTVQTADGGFYRGSLATAPPELRPLVEKELTASYAQAVELGHSERESVQSIWDKVMEVSNRQNIPMPAEVIRQMDGAEKRMNPESPVLHEEDVRPAVEEGPERASGADRAIYETTPEMSVGPGTEAVVAEEVVIAAVLPEIGMDEEMGGIGPDALEPPGAGLGDLPR